MNVEERTEKLVAWIKERVISSGCKGAVFGMSGGIDSSVIAVLCQRAFPQSLLGVLMPCYSNPQDAQHALALASQFAIPTRTVVLDGVFETLYQLLPGDTVDATANRLAKANLKVRLRMLTLYYFSNHLKYMVVGSSNRSELTTGYFTKYGDGGVDIIPLGNLVKREVRALASFLNVPPEIINKPPSAGLWPGQTDEHELGFSYEELDTYLLTGQASDEVRTRIDPMVAAARHKLCTPQLPDF